MKNRKVKRMIAGWDSELKDLEEALSELSSRVSCRADTLDRRCGGIEANVIGQVSVLDRRCGGIDHEVGELAKTVDSLQVAHGKWLLRIDEQAEELSEIVFSQIPKIADILALQGHLDDIDREIEKNAKNAECQRAADLHHPDERLHRLAVGCRQRHVDNDWPALAPLIAQALGEPVTDSMKRAAEAASADCPGDDAVEVSVANLRKDLLASEEMVDGLTQLLARVRVVAEHSRGVELRDWGVTVVEIESMGDEVEKLRAKVAEPTERNGELLAAAERMIDRLNRGFRTGDRAETYIGRGGTDPTNAIQGPCDRNELLDRVSKAVGNPVWTAAVELVDDRIANQRNDIAALQCHHGDLRRDINRIADVIVEATGSSPTLAERLKHLDVDIGHRAKQIGELKALVDNLAVDDRITRVEGRVESGVLKAIVDSLVARLSEVERTLAGLVQRDVY